MVKTLRRARQPQGIQRVVPLRLEQILQYPP